MMKNNETKQSSKSNIVRNRWFALGLSFFVLNAWAVLREEKPHDKLENNQTSKSIATILARTSPDGDATLKERSEIRWNFSGPVVKEEETHTWREVGPFSFTPNQEGMFCWESQRNLVFKPRGKWPVAHVIHSTATRVLKDTQKRPIQVPDINFRTESLRLLGVEFHNGDDNIRFRFNTEVHPEELAKCLMVQPVHSKKTLSIKPITTEPTKSPILAIGDHKTSKLRLEIPVNLRPANGKLGIGECIVRTLDNPKHLRLIKTSTKIDSFGKGDIVLKFSTKVLPENLRGHIDIEPEIPFSILPTKYWWRGHCRIHANFLPTATYRLTFHKGIRTAKGHPNTEAFERTVHIPSRPAGLAFLHRGSHLSPNGNLQLPVNSMNLDQMKVSISRIYPNNLVIFGMRNADKYRSYYGHAHQGISVPVVKEKLWPILNKPNQSVESQIHLRQLLKPPYTGIYHIDIHGERKILHVTDIGISLQRSEKEILVWANSLTTLEPISQANVTFYTEANQILANGQTNAQGLAQISIPANSAEAPFLLTVETGQDLASLFLGETLINSPSNREGRPYLHDQSEAHVFTDRGIYRPGETTHIKAIIRDSKASMTESFPVELQIIQPDGREGRRFHGMLSSNGTVNFDVPWPRTNPLGKYTFNLKTPGSAEHILGTCKSSLEEFTAAKLAVKVQTKKAFAKPHETVEFETEARNLFGRPGTNLPVTGHIRYLPKTFKHPDWKDFRFHDDEKTFPAEHAQLKKIAMGKLSNEGLASFHTEIAGIQPPSTAEILLIATVSDVAGRPVSGSVTCEIHPYPFHIGIHKSVEPRSWEIAAITPKGKTAPDGTPIKLTIQQISRSLLLRKDDSGHYRYHSERHLEEVKESTVHTFGGHATFILKDNLSPGTYLIRVEDEKGGSSASIEWNAGNSGELTQNWAGEEPEKIELSLDQDKYLPGETATLNIAAPFTGKALVIVQQDTILQTHVLRLNAEGSGQISFNIDKKYFPNAWVTVSVIRKIAPGVPHWKPHRAFGKTSLRLSSKPRQLNLEIKAPKQVRPNETFATAIRITTDDGSPSDAEITFALIDEGVLSLTAFRTPDPLSYFHANRKPGFLLHDTYGLLLPETEGTQIGNKLAVGSGAQPALGKFLNPFVARRFTNLARWKPTVQTGPDGKAEVHWDLPEFSGKARLMAIASSKDKFGSAQEHIIVKRPFTVTHGLPRFLAPGDQLTMPLRIYNDSDKEAGFELQVHTSENLKIKNPIPEENGKIAVGGHFETSAQIHAGKLPGKAWVEISATALDESYRERIEIAIRPAYARESRVHTGILTKGEHISLPLSEDFLTGTVSGHFETSPTPDALLGPALESLLGYPYGCLEQTTSGSLPLLYLTDLAKRTRPDLLQKDEVQEYVQAGIHRILSMQGTEGAFGWWPGLNKPFHWGTLYATQFLVESQGAGFTVPQSDLDRSLAWIQTKLSSSSNDNLQTYSLQVLAQAQKLPHGWLDRFWEKRDELDIESRIRLATAFVHSGNRRKAQVLAKTIALPALANNKIRSWQTLGSPLRSRALLLGLHLELDPHSARTTKLAASLQTALGNVNHWSTQENAMLLLTMGKYAQHLGDRSLETTAHLLIDGHRTKNNSAQQNHHFTEGKLPGELRLTNQGPGPLYYSLTLDGIPQSPPKSGDNGIRITRSFLDEDGVPIGDRHVHRGEILRVELSIDTRGNELDHLAIRDLLPAGLEIERSEPSRFIRHKEHRDDRFIIFPNALDGTRKFHYLARAVTTGIFTLPAPTVTCMYDAEIQAIGRSASLTILPD
ncbi:MAG: alpha-2-macroglobulin family protein [Opitutae bacterium]|nr:alpha-2-macroglobulin family protein [Opitutae bacterium]MBT7852925.1 alpha-2-macroglobulin family protein [Opitutae bacterium]